MNVSGAALTQTCQKICNLHLMQGINVLQQPLIKLPSRTCLNILRCITAKFTSRKKIRKCLLFTKFITLNWNWLFSLPWCNSNTFLINYIWNFRNKSCLIWSSSVHVLGGSSTEANFVTLLSFIFSVISFPSEFFFQQLSDSPSISRPFAIETFSQNL